ncbi:hypothetical protein D3C77_370260 [compost metagenome]
MTGCNSVVNCILETDSTIAIALPIHARQLPQLQGSESASIKHSLVLQCIHHALQDWNYNRSKGLHLIRYFVALNLFT